MLNTTTFALPPRRNYIEDNQTNPIRWALYHYEESTNTFTPQTGWFKCKDFFNDVVAWYKDVKGSIYNMNLTTVKLNEYGVWVLLKGINEGFEHNSKFVAEHFGIELNFAPFDDDPSHCLTFFPKEVFKNTFTISLLTLLLRAANEKEEYESLAQLIEKTKESQVRMPQFAKVLKGLPKELQNYWFYCGDRFNPEKWDASYPVTLDSIHSNGCFSWYSSGYRHFDKKEQ